MINLLLKNNKGFTLVEAILYISITTILFLSLTSFVLFLSKTEENNNSKWYLERDSKKIFTIFENIINESSSVSSPNSGNSNSEVSFDGTETNTIILNGTDLEINKNGSAEILNSPEIRVSNFVVENNSDSNVPEIIKISFTLETDGEENVLSESFTTSFMLRDYAN